jgi:hypothetical protein
MKYALRLNLAPRSVLRMAAALLVGAAMVGCFSSTKVVTADKSISYNGSLYNASNVKVFAPRTDAVISATETTPLSQVTKDQFNAILAQHNPLTVRQVISMDQTELVYQTKSVKSWSDYQKMSEQFQSAVKQVTKFMGDPEETQLKLK